MSKQHPHCAFVLVLLASLALGLCLLSSCGGASSDDAERIELPLEQVFAAENIVVVPDRRWENDGEGRWKFRGLGSLHATVRERPAVPLVFNLRSYDLTEAYRFVVRWDGEELFEESLSFPNDGLEVAIDPEKLSPGRHVLELRRRYRDEKKRPAKASHDNVFAELSWRTDGAAVALAIERLEADRYLSDFLAYGVTGRTKQKRGGFVFAGPQATTLELQLASPGTFVANVENSSADEATFVATARSAAAGETAVRAVVAPGERRRLRAALPAGTSRLELVVEGSPDGYYLWGAPWVSRGRGPEKTPIVLITLDTTRRDALSPYSPSPGRSELTPRIEAFAAGATVFENAFSTAPWTLPSHASMFTGLYPSKHGAGVSTDRISAEHETLSLLLRQAGYLTAGFAGGDLCSFRFGVGRYFNRYRDPDHFETTGDKLTGYVKELLAEHGSEPLFLFVNYFDAHGPYRAPEAFHKRVGLAERSAAVRGQEVWEALANGEQGAWQKVGRSDVESTPEGVDYLHASYLAEVAFMDEQVGELFDALERHGLYERALIVVVADHGELLGEGGHFGHSGRLDPELVEVPLIVKWPGQTEGRRVDTMVSGVDVFATILETAGATGAKIEVPANDGTSLSETALTSLQRQQVFAEEHTARVHPLNPNLRIADHVYSVQRPRFRQVVWDGGEECQRLADQRLADQRLADQRLAWEDAACTRDHTEVLIHLERVLQANPRAAVDDAGVMSREVEESLRALGYLD